MAQFAGIVLDRAESKLDVTALKQEESVSEMEPERQEKKTVEEGAAEENGDSLFVVVVVVKMS